jgi:ribosomal protein S18 acetylase RimI-like enzyme
LLLAFVDDQPAGCVALHKLDDKICEMKRLYVRPAFRKHNLGRKLIDAVLAASRKYGYTHMRLDTVTGVMDSAIALYRKYGFKEIASYCVNPQPGVIYMELDLAAGTKQ